MTSPADLFDPAIRVADPVPPPAPGAMTALRGYPLPPWAADMRHPRDGAEVLSWLLDLVEADTFGQAAAYLAAQRADLGTALLRAVRAEEDVDNLTARLAQLRNDAAVLEELLVAAGAPAVSIATELELDEAGLEVLRVTLAYDPAAPDQLDEEALERIVEAAAQAAHLARNRELAANRIVRTDAERRAGVVPLARPA